MEYSFEDIIRHPIQLNRVSLTSINMIKYINEEENGEVERNITISTSSQAITGEYGYLDATLNIVASMNNEDYYHLNITYRGECQNLDDSISQKEYEYFLDIQAIRMIWPYFRETIPSILIKMGATPFQLPTIDVLETISNAVVENNENE